MNDNLNIAVVRMHKLNTDSRVKAFADIKINDSLLIKGLSVVESDKGCFVSMPRQKGSNDVWYDSVKPLNKQTRAEIQSAVLVAYSQE